MTKIFNSNIPIDILYNFLNLYCNRLDNYIIFDSISYKKLLYYNQIEIFYNNIKQYYNKDKIFYIERDISYTNLLTIIRQILNYHKVKYYRKIKYNNSKYDIVYYIDLCSNTF